MRRSDVFSVLSENDMEEELEKTKVVKAFWDLRQEVRQLDKTMRRQCLFALYFTKIHLTK